MILESAVLDVRPGQAREVEAAFGTASAIIPLLRSVPDRRALGAGRYFTARGLSGEPRPPLVRIGGALRRKTHVPSAAQSAASASS